MRENTDQKKKPNMDIFQLVTFEHLDYQDLQQLFQYHFFIIFCFLFFLLKTFESVESRLTAVPVM